MLARSEVSVKTKRKNLNDKMNSIEVSPSLVRAMNELCYTASETGLIPFAFHDDSDLAAMVRLVRLAEKYINGVPDELCM